VKWRRRRPNGHDLTCQQAVALVTAYLDGDLQGDARKRFEAHLNECDMCAEHVKQIRVTISVAGRVRDEDLDPIAREDLLQLYRSWRDDPAPS
jgi:anti-sigma factor RsiW